MTDDRRREHRVVVASLAVIAAAVLVGAFFAGTRLGSRADAAAPLVTPRSAPTATAALRAPIPSPAPTKGPVAPGTHPWQALLGGECLDPYTSPWQATYTVVPCSTSHTGQMTERVHLEGARYPGSAAMIATLSLACASAKSVDLAAARQYPDLRIAYSYPTTAQWAAGDDHGACFVSRAGGAHLERSVAP